MQTWIVSKSWWDTTELEGAFSSETLAKEHIDRMEEAQKADPDSQQWIYEYEELGIDALVPNKTV